MVTQWFMEFLHTLAATAFSALSAMIPSPPTFWSDGVSAFNTVLGIVSGPIASFLPLGPVMVAGGAMLGLTVTLGLLRLARRVLSLFTGGGGNA